MKKFVVCRYNNDLILRKVEVVEGPSRLAVVDDETDSAWNTVIVMTPPEARKIAAAVARVRRSGR